MTIRSEREYQEAVANLEAARRRLDEHVKAWKKAGFTPEQVAKLREPLDTLHRGLTEELQGHERLKSALTEGLAQANRGELLDGPRTVADIRKTVAGSSDTEITSPGG